MAMNPETLKTFSLKDSENKKNKKNKEESYKDGDTECKLVYQIRFLCKDPSTAKNPYLYSILLYSHDDMASDFFNDEPKNLYLDEDALANVTKKLDLLTKFNIYVEAIAEQKNGWLMIKDTTMNI